MDLLQSASIVYKYSQETTIGLESESRHGIHQSKVSHDPALCETSALQRMAQLTFHRN